MLDAETGALHISAECVLEPDTTIEAFRGYACSADATILVDNPPYLTVGVKADERSGRRQWSLALCFEHDRIAMIVITDVTGDTEENQYDEAWEKKRKARHDRWLRKQLAGRKGRTFSWGTIESFIDQREASIVLNYGILTGKPKE